jgi:HTH-type transcriptional regulator/antitoxin HigA
MIADGDDMTSAWNIQGSWAPNWATHPGEHLQEYLLEFGLSQADFARLAGLTPKLVSTILSKSNPVTADTAIRFERVLGLKADIWTGIQADWDLYEARRRDAAARAEAPEASAWMKQFPIRELVARGCIPPTRDAGDQMAALLALLGVGTAGAYDARVQKLAVHHRQAKRGQSSPHHVFAWLMVGEQRAREMDLPSYQPDRFRDALRAIRELTVEEPAVFEPRMISLCRDAGVAIVFEKPISKTCLFGSARWLSEDRAIIQMSLRMKSNDHFWWTFFHEAGHLVLHRGMNFADDQNGEGDGVEREADCFAEEELVGTAEFESFCATKPAGGAAISSFAKTVGIHAGIVVGMLQHRGLVEWSQLNWMKARFEWADEIERRR